jgi:hypothetical protein
MDSFDGIIYPVMGFFWGLYLYYTGFKDLKSKRTIQDIPTSKISTGAIGTNVEIKGEILIEDENLLIGPISNKPCAFYSLEIQKLVKTKDSSHWKTVDSFFSDKGFYVDDNSGAIALVIVEGATIKRKGPGDKFQMSSNNFDEMPANLRKELDLHANDLKTFKAKDTSWLFSRQYRFLEWRFTQGEQIYILGFAKSGLRLPKKEKLKLKYYMKAKKLVESKPKLKNRFDANKDGVLSPAELEWGAKNIGKILQKKYTPKKVEEIIPKTKMIFKKKSSSPFIISNMQERELISSMGWTATAKIWGGPIITVVSGAILAIQFY